MPEDTHSREVVGGSLWTGEVFGLFIFKGGGKLTTEKRQAALVRQHQSSLYQDPKP
jgi:hypothetical protein